jgi:hypothetical protein
MDHIDPNNTSHHICNCTARCGSSGKSVSIATYNRHAQNRHRDQFEAPFNAFLASLQIDEPSSRGGGVRRKSRSLQQHVEQPRKTQGECDRAGDGQERDIGFAGPSDWVSR